MNAVNQTVAGEPVSGAEIFVPLAELKNSPRNARKVPHGKPLSRCWPLRSSIEG